MIAIEPRPATQAAAIDERERLQGLCRTLFTRRRKQLGSILGRDIDWPAGIDPTARPEALTIDQLRALAAAVAC
jgi:16S rRNA A1518/A1519 N6-dimethyltransferase RsmA/KsgA/DIM1 with predicted DNA glycosylase/AP lyase activity